MTRLIFIDVDGTLIDERQTVPDSAREALVAAAEAGNRLMLCTGRSIPELYPWLWDLGFTGLVGAAGAYVRVDEDVIADRRIDAETLRRSTQVLRSHGIAWLWQAPEDFYASDSFLEAFTRPDEDEDDAWMPYRRQIAPYLDYGEPRSASKATFVLPRGSDITIDGLDRALGDSLRADPGTVQTGAREVGEILIRDVSKATGLADVAAYLDVPIADCTEGRVTDPEVPTPRRELICAVPPWRATIVATSARPRPLPGCPPELLARLSSSQTAPTSSAGMPIPVSATSTVTVPWPSEPRISMTDSAPEYFAAFETRLYTAE